MFNNFKALYNYNLKRYSNSHLRVGEMNTFDLNGISLGSTQRVCCEVASLVPWNMLTSKVNTENMKFI